MITITHPNGRTYTYPTAGYMTIEQGAYVLLDRPGGRWLATFVSAPGLVIESSNAFALPHDHHHDHDRDLAKHQHQQQQHDQQQQPHDHS